MKLNKKNISIFQIIMLVISIFAIAWVIGSSLDVVSAEEPCAGKTEEDLMFEVCSKEGDYKCQNLEVGLPKLIKCMAPFSNVGTAGMEQGKIYWQPVPGKADCISCENCECVTETTTPPPTVITTPPPAVTLPDTNRKNGENCTLSTQCKSGNCDLGKCKEDLSKPPQKSGEGGGDGLNNALGLYNQASSVANGVKSIEGLQKGDKSKEGNLPDTSPEGVDKTTKKDYLEKLSPEDLKSFKKKSKTEQEQQLKNNNVEDYTSMTASALGTFLGAAAGSFAAAYGYAYVAQLLGASERNVQSLKSGALYIALATTVVVTLLAKVAEGAVLVGLFEALGVLGAGLTATGIGIFAAVVVVVAMTIYLLASYQTYSQEIFTYTIQSWQPPKGGESCLDCNKLRYGCSEYQCHSFGQACEIANKGTTDEACIWVNENDILPPTLTPMNSVLREGFSYIPATAVLPKERGVKIVYGEGCIPPFTSLVLGVETNEPANCKIDTTRKDNLTDMLSYMQEGSANVYNHTLLIPSSALSSNSSLQGTGLEIENNQDYVFYIRCEDTNGNPTTSNFLMEFCVDSGPDTMAPIIESTSYPQNSFISFNKTTIPLEVYTNEPADCKWDFQDLDYSLMGYNMTDCSQQAGDFLSQYYYGCKTELSGIKNEQTNNYYIKCKDQPWFETNPDKRHLRNENKQSYVLSLTGTPLLIIDEILINDRENGAMIKDATDTIKATIKVKTSAGAEEGKARCAYEINDKYIYFFNNGVPEFIIENTQDLWLEEGTYNYSIRCEDIGGNLDYSNALFTIKKDTSPPEVSRVYHEQGNLKLITNEPAQCVYSNLGCNYAFEDGSEIDRDVDGYYHFVTWETQTNYHIKCKDKFGNYPIPQDQCSIIVRGSGYS